MFKGMKIIGRAEIYYSPKYTLEEQTVKALKIILLCFKHRFLTLFFAQIYNYHNFFLN